MKCFMYLFEYLKDFKCILFFLEFFPKVTHSFGILVKPTLFFSANLGLQFPPHSPPPVMIYEQSVPKIMP